MNRRDTLADRPPATPPAPSPRMRLAPAIAAVALAALPLVAGAAEPGADGSAALARAKMDAYRCYVCHGDDEPKAGPAFADVAAAYRKARDPVGTMANVIRTGKRSGGPWHMPPHPETSPADARTIARYILALPPPLPAAAPAPTPAPPAPPAPTSKVSP